MFYSIWTVLIIGSLLVGAYFRRQRLALIATLLTHMLTKQQQGAQIVETPSYARITYLRRGRTYHLFVPFRRPLGGHDQLKVYLLRDGAKIDITQQPGMPYFVTAAELGGTGYEVYDQTTAELLSSHGPHTLITTHG